MRVTILILAVAVALGAAPRFAAAQSLAEIAAKEKERRKGTSGKVITESDLRSAGHGTDGLESEGAAEGDATAPADGASPADDSKANDKSDDKRADRQAALQKEIDAERTHIEGIKKDIATRENELGDPTFNGPGVTTGRREALQKYLDAAKQAVATHEAQVEKLLGQARSEGIPIR